MTVVVPVVAGVHRTRVLRNDIEKIKLISSKAEMPE